MKYLNLSISVYYNTQLFLVLKASHSWTGLFSSLSRFQLFLCITSSFSSFILLCYSLTFFKFKYRFSRTLIQVQYRRFQIFLVLGQFPGKSFLPLHCSDSAYCDCTGCSGSHHTRQNYVPRTSYLRLHMVLYLTPRDAHTDFLKKSWCPKDVKIWHSQGVPYRCLEGFSCRRYEDVPIWSNM